jgi:hypothetical protein
VSDGNSTALALKPKSSSVEFAFAYSSFEHTGKTRTDHVRLLAFRWKRIARYVNIWQGGPDILSSDGAKLFWRKRMTAVQNAD